MLKEKVVFAGIGQGGCNIVEDLYNFNCQTYFINTSLDDLDTIDAPYNKKYHISGTKGMAKDITYANEIINSDYNDDKIVEAVYKEYANASIYFFVFTSAGGTGGGMGVQIANKFKERFPDKIVDVITVYPHKEEDMIMQYNAKICLENIKKSMDNGIITNVQIIDNNKKDFNEKLELNSEFAKVMDKILSYNGITSEGNLDEEEFERLFMVNGIITIHELSNKNFLDDLNDADENSLYAQHKKDPEVHGLILNSEQNTSVNRNLIREVFGIPKATHDTIWDEDYNIIISTGMTFNDNLINILKKNYLDLKLKKEQIEKDGEITIDESVDVDFKDMNSLSVKTNIPNSSNVTRRERRKVGVKNETRFRR